MIELMFVAKRLHILHLSSGLTNSISQHGEGVELQHIVDAMVICDLY